MGASSPREATEHRVPSADVTAFFKEQVLWFGWCVGYKQEGSKGRWGESVSKRIVKSPMAC